MSLDAVLRTGQRLQAEAPERFRLEAAGPLARAAEAPTGTVYELVNTPETNTTTFEVKECPKGTDSEGYECLMVKVTRESMDSVQRIREQYFRGAKWVKVGFFNTYSAARAHEYGTIKVYGTKYGDVVLHPVTYKIDWDYDVETVKNDSLIEDKLRYAQQLFMYFAWAARAYKSKSGNTELYHMRARKRWWPK